MRQTGPSARAAGGIALALGAIAFGGATLVLWRAWASADDGHADFWGVAVPGVAIGLGTALLALATVWIAHRERKAASWARAESDRTTALREASKVFPVIAADLDGHAVIAIVNAGREPVLDVHVVRGLIAENDDGSYVWDPVVTMSVDDWRETSTQTTYIPSGSQVNFQGDLIREHEERIYPVDLRDVHRMIEQAIPIAWTDSGGLHWRRTGLGKPEMFNQPYEPPAH